MKMEKRLVEGSPGIAIFVVEGVVDSVNVTDFFQAINKLFKEGENQLILDLGPANYLSSGALSVIADAFRKAESLGGRVVVCGASESIRELFSVVQFDRLFDFYPDAETAIASFSPVS